MTDGYRIVALSRAVIAGCQGILPFYNQSVPQCNAPLAAVTLCTINFVDMTIGGSIHPFQTFHCCGIAHNNGTGAFYLVGHTDDRVFVALVTIGLANLVTYAQYGVLIAIHFCIGEVFPYLVEGTEDGVIAAVSLHVLSNYRIVHTGSFSRPKSIGCIIRADDSTKGCIRRRANADDHAFSGSGTIVIVVALTIRKLGVHAVIMDFIGCHRRIHLFQLGHVDSVRIFRTCSHTRDLAGHGAIGLTHRNGRIGSRPSSFRIRTCISFRVRLIPLYTCFYRSHRSAADGHAAFHGNIGVMTNDDCIGSICHRIFIICGTQDDVILTVGQFMVITQHQVGLVLVYTGTGNGVMRTNDVVVPAVFQGVVEAVHIVQLGRCAFCVFLAAAGDLVAYAYHLCHIGARHGVAAAHDHDLAAAGGNGILQRTIQCFRILQVLHDGTGLLEVDGPIGIGDAVSCAVDQGGIGIGGHIGLADDAVRYAAEGLGSAGIVINVECAIGEGCGAAEIIASRSSRFIHDAGEGTGHGGSDAAGIGHVPCCEACKFLGSFVVRIGIRFEPVDDRHFSIVRFVDAVILSLGIIADPFQLGHVDGVRVFRTGRHIRDLAGHLLGCITYRNGSCRRFPCARGIAAVVLPFQVEANGAFIGRRHGTIAYSHAPIFLDVGIMAQEDSVGNLRRQCCIRRTDGNVVLHILVHGVVVTDDDQVITFLGFGAITLAQNAIFCICRERLAQDCVVGTDYIGIVGIGDLVVVAINHIVLAAIFIDFGAAFKFMPKNNAVLRIFVVQATGHFIVDAHDLCPDGPVDFIAAADSQRCTAGAVFDGFP